MKFDYINILFDERSAISESKTAIRPIIPIKIKAEGGMEIGYYALIDSGADFCIFDGEIGEAIGIDVRSGPENKFGGVQSSKKQCIGYVHTVCLSVGGHDIPSRVCFSYDINKKQGYGIVGQYGFFDSFRIKFDYSKERIELDIL
jgi:hypothetical protein